MASIPDYRNFEEKEPNFHYRRIDSEAQLDSFFDEIDQGTYFYRGVKEAKYKVFSSSQREWIGKELINRFGNYDVFVNELIQQALQINGGFIRNVLTHFGTNANELAVLSYLQHYGAPTPLIDFTVNKFKGLFFAIDGARHFPAEGISNYVSVYKLRVTEDFTNLRDVLENAYAQLDAMASQHPPGAISNLGAVARSLETFSQAISWNNPIYLSDVGVSDDAYRLGINSNINIVAQEGIFVLNPSNERPLEDQFHGITLNSWRGTDQRDRNSLFFDRMYCVDIHKSFIPRIESRLRSMNIYSATMYPQNEEMAKACYNNILI